MKRKLRNDLLLLGALAAAGVVLVLVLHLTRETGAQVVVQADGERVAEFSLSEPVEYTIQSRDGGINELRIADGAVWLESANCPDGLCVKQGKIRYVGESIICLPHAVVVEITGRDELGLDAVTK